MKKVIRMIVILGLLTILSLNSFALRIEELDLGHSIDTVGYFLDPFEEENDDILYPIYHKNIDNDELIEYGTTVYFPILNEFAEDEGVGSLMKDAEAAADYMLTDTASARHIYLRAKWEIGEEHVKNVEIVKERVTEMYPSFTADEPVMINELSDADANKNRNYFYFVAVTFEESFSTDTVEVDGEIILKNSGGDFEFQTPDNEISFGVQFELGYAKKSDYFVREKYTLLDFEDEEDEIEVYFEADDYSYFTVIPNTQGNLLSKADIEYDKTQSPKFPGLELSFFNGYGLRFNNIGEMNLYSELGGFLYEIIDDKVYPISAEYDEFSYMFSFKTNHVGRYMIVEEELVLNELGYVGALPKALEEELEKEESDSSESLINPSTGGMQITKRQQFDE